MGKTKPFKNYNAILSPNSSTPKPSIFSRLGKTKQKPPSSSVYSRVGSKTPDFRKVVLPLVLPKQPTPLTLYHCSRENELLAGGLSKDKIYQICLKEYKELSDLHKMKWILQSLLKEPDYKVEYEQFKKEHPDVHVPRRQNLLSSEDLEVKQRYESESNRETLPVPDTDSDSDHKELPSRKPFKAKAKLPRKPTPYFLYHNSRMKDLKAKGKSRDETLKICTRDYFAMHDDEKLNWILLALEETPAYLSALERYQKENQTYQLDSKSHDVLDEHEWEIKNRPVQKLPNIGFDLFVRHLLTGDKFKALQPDDRNLMLSIRWENMTEEEKSEYNIEAAKMNLNHPIEYATYLQILPPELRARQVPLMWKAGGYMQQGLKVRGYWTKKC